MRWIWTLEGWSRLGNLYSGMRLSSRVALLSWNETRRSVLKPCLRPYPRSLLMLAFPWAEMISLPVVTASNQARRRHIRIEISGNETFGVRKVSAFKFETGITTIMVSVVSVFDYGFVERHRRCETLTFVVYKPAHYRGPIEVRVLQYHQGCCSGCMLIPI